LLSRNFVNFFNKDYSVIYSDNLLCVLALLGLYIRVGCYLRHQVALLLFRVCYWCRIWLRCACGCRSYNNDFLNTNINRFFVVFTN